MIEHLHARIRHARQEDLDALTQIYNHYVRHSVSTFDTEPFATDARQSWFVNHAVGTPHQLWVAEQQGSLLGYASSSQFRPKPAYDTSVETSVYVHPDHLGRGFGRVLYEHLFEHLEPFQLRRAYAGITQPNAASVALHSSLGFTLIGNFSEAGRKFGGYHDVHFYEKALHTPLHTPLHT